MSPLAMVMQGKLAGSRLAILDDSSRTRSISIRIAYLLLQQLDLLLTVWAVNAGFTELNPVMQNLLASPLQLILVKFAIPVLIAWLCPSRLLLPSLLLISSVTFWNVKELMLLIL